MSSEDTAAPTDSMEELALADARPQSLEMRREEPPNWGWDEEFYQSEETQGLQSGEKTSTRQCASPSLTQPELGWGC